MSPWLDMYYAQIDHARPLTTAGEELDHLLQIMIYLQIIYLSEGCTIDIILPRHFFIPIFFPAARS